MAMRVRLIERGNSPEQTREVSINQQEFVIGRGADCDLRLRDTEISRHHCIIRVGADEAALVDLGSSNGTYLNGQHVRSQAPLHSGDELRLGSATFVIDLGEPGGTKVDVPDADPLARTIKLKKP
jgi:pSer/pThr/pTyr-binding forkhead associated (FHA) protein